MLEDLQGRESCSGYAESDNAGVKGNVIMRLEGRESLDKVNWQAVADLIAAAGLNQREIGLVEQAFRHSAFCWFGYEKDRLIAVARAISDLTWCSYLADVAVLPHQQGKGYGQQLMQAVQNELLPFGKIFIYAVADKMDFYRRFGFETLATGMVCASDESLLRMREQGYIR